MKGGKKYDSLKCSTSAKLNESEELRPALWLISFGLTCWSGLYVVCTRLCILVGVCSRLNLFPDSNLGAFSLVTENGLISAPFHSKSILSGPSHKFFFALFCFVLFCVFLPHLFFLLSLLFLKRRWESSRERHFLKIICFFFCTFYFPDTKIWFVIINLPSLHQFNFYQSMGFPY